MSAPKIFLDRPWLIFDLGMQMRVLSWAINKPGFVNAHRIVWREVCNADLPIGVDVYKWLSDTLREKGEIESVAFLTSRNIQRFKTAITCVDSITTVAVATVGLSNAERVGFRCKGKQTSYGTINIAAQLDKPLSEFALIEALSIAVQARTTAILDSDISTICGRATGTGTDCVAIAAPIGNTDYAGLHTDIGESLGHAVYEAVYTGAEEWKIENNKVI